MPLHDERLMVAIPLQCLFIIQMPNRRVLINALHYAWELRCSILNTFIRFLMFYLSNQPAIYSYSSQWVVALIQKQEHRMIFMMMMMMPWRCVKPLPDDDDLYNWRWVICHGWIIQMREIMVLSDFIALEMWILYLYSLYSESYVVWDKICNFFCLFGGDYSGCWAVLSYLHAQWSKTTIYW